MTSEPNVWIVRHGQTEWSLSGQHTGSTDIPLTAEGEVEAEALGTWAATVHPDLVLCSPRTRAQRTAMLAGFSLFRVTDDLQEWNYGKFEGRTSADIRAEYPDWEVWTGPWVGGETAGDVTARADRLIQRVRSSGAERVVLVGHGHFSRVLAARWTESDVTVGRWLALDTGTWSHLGWDRSVPVIRHWNVPATDRRT